MPGRRPNFILFNPETVRADAVFGDPAQRARTPNMDRLAREGVSFTHAFCQMAYCAPSRISMFTGLYPHTGGHRSLCHLLHRHERNLFMDLREAGYRTYAFGKNDLLAQDSTAACFDEVRLRVAPGGFGAIRPPPPGDRLEHCFYLGRREGECHDHDWAAVASALSVIDQADDTPFCLYLPLHFAHPPYVVEEPFFSLHDRDAVPAPIPYREGARRRFVDLLHRVHGCDRLDECDFREIRATYFGMVSRVDDQLGLLLERLERTGQADNTVVVVFSDHGDYAGDFGLIEKFLAGFEDCLLRVPLIFRMPGAEGGRAFNGLVEMTDLYMTLAQIAGIEPRHYHFSRSLLPAMAGEVSWLRDAVFAEGGRHADESQFLPPIPDASPYRRMRDALLASPESVSRALMVRTDRWKYVYSPHDGDELYDLAADPCELQNLAGDPAVASTRDALRERLLRWMLDTGDTLPLERDPRGW